MGVRWVFGAVVVIALLMLSATNSPRGARAQGADELDSLHTQVSQLYDERKYAEAAAVAERYVALARQKYGEDHIEYATAVARLADFYKAQGRHTEAEPLLKRSLAIAEKASGPDHLDVGSALNSLALLYSAEGRISEAEPLLKRSLAITEKVLGPEHLTVGTALNTRMPINYHRTSQSRMPLQIEAC